MRPSQLEGLTGISARYWAAWGKSRNISERFLLQAAQALGLSIDGLLTGLNLRRVDAAQAQATRAKVEKLIQFKARQVKARQEHHDNCVA